MKFPARSVACLLPFFLTACFHLPHKRQALPTAPVIVNLPPDKAPPAPTTQPPPVVTIPLQPTAPPPAATMPAEEPLKPPIKHKKPANKNPQQAAIPNPGVSAIGQLSSGDPADFRRETEDLINATERGLKSLNRSLNDQEQKTAAHIRDFLKQARQALASGDVDGAHTLTAKAKVLLSELSR